MTELCPRCEDAQLARATEALELAVAGLAEPLRLAKVAKEVCPACGFSSLSGREVALVEIVLAPRFATVRELVEALRDAGASDLFLGEEVAERRRVFGRREYVAGLAADLRDLYLDHESHHALGRLQAALGTADVELPTGLCQVVLPHLGEGENGVVFDCPDRPGDVLKLAKPRPYSRGHLLDEVRLTALFDAAGIPVPAIRENDPYGSYLFKERLEGRSLSAVHADLEGPGEARHERVKAAVGTFVDRLLRFFEEHPEARTSVSPNNIFVDDDGADCRCLLIDTGPAPLHDYRDFDFEHYWTAVIPRKIEQYRRAGYL